MNCPDVRQLLHPYVDGELDLVRQIEIEGHLAGCDECRAREINLLSLRTAITSSSLGHAAPASLRSRIQLSIPASDFARRRRGSTMRWTTIAAGVLLAIGMSAVVGGLLSQGGNSVDERFAERVVVGHVRSLQVAHLTDVASTDRHTVKPWFQEKIDFAPQVPDLSSQGYPLFGGRLDYLIDRSVVALVYHRRLHTINVFTWPALNNNDKPARALTRQGFHIRQWQRSGMTYWAISDLNDQELDEFVRFFDEHCSE
jgi:anti-sigma factor RsiW